jgi:hypothetical protein
MPAIIPHCRTSPMYGKKRFLQADFYKDGHIDLLDYVRLADQWLWKSSWRR